MNLIKRFCKNQFQKKKFIFKAKKAFIHLQKTFTKILILWYFDPECHILIETKTLEYAIGEISSQMTLDYSNQLFSNYVTYKNLDSNFLSLTLVNSTQ